MSSPTNRLLGNQDERNYRSTESQASASRSSDHADASASINSVDPTSAREEFVVVEDHNEISRILEECEKKFLKPYRTMLQFLGWAPNSKGSYVRVILVMFWFLIIVATSITQILSCFRRDMFIPGDTRDRNGTTKVITCENHLISTFILLDLLIITSYAFGIYLFSKGETEYLSTLAEKVFLKNSDANLGNKNGRLTWTIFAFILLAIIWIILSITVRILTALSVRHFTDQTIIMLRSHHIIQGATKLGLIIFSLIGFIFFDVVYVSAVMNYVAQSEMNIYLMSAIKSLVVNNKYHSNMKAAMKDIVECRECLRVLNGKTATATALILFNLGSAALVSLITLNDISEQELPREDLATTAAGLNVILWIALVTFPFIQAARVTHAADKLKETGPEIPHLWIYENTPTLDLDFYLHLTQAIKLRSTNDLAQQALDQCDKRILRHYRRVLRFLGWAPFEHAKKCRVVVILFWSIVIFATSATQIRSCFHRDMFTPGEADSHEHNRTLNVITCPEHLISSFILLDILILASYWFGVYLFSSGETEYLYNLAEKVFFKNFIGNRGHKNKQLTRTIGAFFVLGVAWISLSTVVRLLTAFSVRVFDNRTIIHTKSNQTIQGAEKLALIILSLFGFIFFDMVYVSAVMNYATQSEMNIYFFNAISRLVIDNKYRNNLRDAKKDIIECRTYMDVLNGKTATATALILFNLASAALVSLITLDGISEKGLPREVLATITSGFNVILWIVSIIFPFIQAARVTHAAEKLKETGPQISHLQLYDNTSQLDLDSYLHLTHAIKLRATMFGIPIYPWMVYAVLVAFTFTMLLLSEFGVYNFTTYL